MKKRIWRFLTVTLASVLLLSACGEYQPAVKEPGDGRDTTPESETEPVVTDENGEVDENPFTVTLTCDGEVYIPDPENPISVQWNDGFSLHSAPVGEDGVARVGGLDGDYKVTLSAIPEGYGYDPNGYTATNNDRNVEIELHKIITTRGLGNGLYDCIEIKNTGVYCVELTGPSQEIFFEFAPPKSGTYSVESWTDTIADEINPYANYYGANAFFKQLQYVCNDGGAENSYTKNFKLVVEIADEMISTDGGQTTFSFGIKGTNKNGKYPIRVYFAVKLDGGFSLPYRESTIMVPSETLMRQPDYDSSEYEFVGAEFPVTVGNHTANVFDGDNYKLWPKDEGGDNYYHLYDEAKYPETHGYGPILYAHITSACRFLDLPFTQIEYKGNKALTVSSGTENYKLFIEGFAALNGGMTNYFCADNCPCRQNGTCNSDYVGACTEACTNCHVDCRRCPEEALGKSGYADYTNSDGVYGVTEELKEFLQKYSVNQLLFFDGNGFVETNPTVSVYAAEEDQWLFACGYYRERE